MLQPTALSRFALVFPAKEASSKVHVFEISALVAAETEPTSIVALLKTKIVAKIKDKIFFKIYSFLSFIFENKNVYSSLYFNTFPPSFSILFFTKKAKPFLGKMTRAAGDRSPAALILPNILLFEEIFKGNGVLVRGIVLIKIQLGIDLRSNGEFSVFTLCRVVGTADAFRVIHRLMNTADSVAASGRIDTGGRSRCAGSNQHVLGLYRLLVEAIGGGVDSVVRQSYVIAL